MPYPDKVLLDDEEVLVHLHPHWSTVFWPVVFLLVLVGATSFGAAALPAGPHQAALRLAVLGLAAVLVLAVVVRPLLRWATTHYVVTTHRLLVRLGALARSGRDVGFARIADVSFSQTLGQRLLRSGTVTVEPVGEARPVVLQQVPRSDGFQQLVNQLVDEAAERGGWAAERSGWAGTGPADDGWGTRVR